MKVGDIVVWKPPFCRAAKQFPGCSCTTSGGIVTWVQDSDSVTYQVEVDWGNGGQRTTSYMIEPIDAAR